MRKVVLVFLLSMPLVANAYVPGGSNLDIFGYPKHKCLKPDRPVRPYDLSNKWAVDSYNSQVESFNFERQTYLDCIMEYLANAKRDIERIKEASQSVVEEANAP